MNKICVVTLFMASLFMFGCGPSIDTLSGQVRGSIQQQFDTSEQFKSYGLKVEKVTLFHEQDKKYRGIVSVVHNGSAHDVVISVLADSNGFMWEAQPGAFMFLAQAEVQKILNPSKEDAAKYQADFEKEVALEYEEIQRQAKLEYEKMMAELKEKQG